jgi:hypothetical protein
MVNINTVGVNELGRNELALLVYISNLHYMIHINTLSQLIPFILLDNYPLPLCFIVEWKEKEYTLFRHLKRTNPLTPNDHYSSRTAPLTSKRCILYIYSTNIGTEYFKNGIYSPFFFLQNAVCFIILTYLIPVLFIFYIQVC